MQPYYYEVCTNNITFQVILISHEDRVENTNPLEKQCMFLGEVSKRQLLDFQNE